MMRVLSILAVLAALLTGCGLSRPYPAKSEFSLYAGEATRTSNRLCEPLRVEPVRIAAPYHERPLVYRLGEVSFRADYYSEFFAAPSALATSEIIRLLDASGAFDSVLEPASTADTQLRLETFISEFYADQRHPEDRKAVVAVRYRLVRDDRGRSTTLGEWPIVETSPIESDSAEDAARAIGLALGKTVVRLVEAICPTSGSGQ
jgi:uncharacterized lipoprotein YmbA